MIVEYHDDVIFLSGELRSNFWETVHTTISLLLKRHPSGVVIDCSGITEITPDGGETFHDVLRYVREHEGARIILATVPEAVQKTLRQVPEVRSQLPMVDSLEEARRSLDLLVQDESKKDRKRREPTQQADRRLLVCVTGDPADVDVLKLAAELSAAQASRVTLLFPVIVPRELPLQSPMPEEEAIALGAIDRAKQSLGKLGASYDARVERARELATLLKDMSDEVNAAYVVVAIPKDIIGKDTPLNLMKSVLHKVDRQLLFVRSASK